MNRTPETEQWLTDIANPEFWPRIRAAMKEKKISAAAIGRRAGKSSSFAAVVVRGDYPYRGANGCTKGIWNAMSWMGLPTSAKVNNATTPPTEA